jgi:thiamine-phosphate pyrophosphorylase
MTNPKEKFYRSATRIYCFADTVALCEKLLNAGARVIQLRNKSADDKTFRNIAAEMLTHVRRFDDAVLIVNDRVEIAIEIGADGIHVGQKDEDYRSVIRRVPEGMIAGVSARYPDLAEAAVRAGATYVGTGAVFSTPTKPDAKVIGLDGLLAVVERVTIPVVAVGGISEKNIRQVLSTGVRYCAMISEINRAVDVKATYCRLAAACSNPHHAQITHGHGFRYYATQDCLTR